MKFNKSLPELEACIDKIYQTSLGYLADNCSTAKPS